MSEWTQLQCDPDVEIRIIDGGLQIAAQRGKHGIPFDELFPMLRSAGYLIHAPGAEADRARSDAEIARLVVEVERAVYDDAVSPEEHWTLKRALVKIVDARIAADDALAVDAAKAPRTIDRIMTTNEEPTQ